jgi:hypothetical protein
MIQTYLMNTEQRSNTDLKFTPARITQQLWKISSNMSSTQILTSFNMLGQTVAGHNAAKLILLWTIVCHMCNSAMESLNFLDLIFT